MQVVEVPNSKTNRVSLHCGDCLKILGRCEEGLEEWSVEDATNLMLSLAIRHIQKHPTHNPNIFLYRKEPNETFDVS